jgi:hypothetical protein
MTKPFWTMFYYGDAIMRCSQHTTLASAVRAAKKCHKQGGARHRILKVRDMTPPKMDR